MDAAEAEVIAIVVAVLAGLVGLFFALGWIIPLSVGRIRRRRNLPGARGWTIFGCVWGGCALLWAVVIGAGVFLASRIGSSYEDSSSKAPDFDMAAYKGDVGTLRVSFTGESRLVVSDKEHGNMKFAATNGMFSVPAGGTSRPELRGNRG